MTTQDILTQAAAARRVMAVADTAQKNRALGAMGEALLAHTPQILAANEADLEAARSSIGTVMLDRLALNEGRIQAMAEGMAQVAQLPDPVGRELGRVERPNGLCIRKVSVPMGTVAIIYESRPNVTADAAALCIKSGNACVLRGGKEAFGSNQAIVDALQAGLGAAGLPKAAVSLIQDTSRDSAQALMRANGLVDLLIPRGGAGLIQACVETATVPCIQTGTGICHIYVDAAADLEMALNILGKRQDQPALRMQRGGGMPGTPGGGGGLFAGFTAAPGPGPAAGGQGAGGAAPMPGSCGDHPRHAGRAQGF